MPITNPLNDPDVPLGQGDILKGITLFSTAQPSDGGGIASSGPQKLCLVLSRPCTAVRDEWVQVAAIEKYNKAPPKFDDFDECLAFFTAIRDGLKSPDLFYLGQLAGEQGSFCARFDNIHRIHVPRKLDLRQQFLQDFRIARLHKDFIHDLHLRHFRSYASLGFDDHGWYETADLKVVVAQADSDLAKVNAELAPLKAQIEMARAQAGDAKGAQQQAERLQKKVG